MQSDSPLPPQSQPTPPGQPGILEEMAALTGLFNPEIIWEEETLLDDMDEQDSLHPGRPGAPAELSPDQP